MKRIAIQMMVSIPNNERVESLIENMRKVFGQTEGEDNFIIDSHKILWVTEE